MAVYQSELNVSNLKDIIKALKQSYFPSHRWSPLGLQLGLLQPTLSSIRTKYRDDPETCLQECLTQWLSKADKVTENGGPTWDSLSYALKTIEEFFAAEQIKEFNELSTPACQMLHKHSDKILPLTLPVEIIQMLYTEKVISKETLDEINRLGGVLGDDPLKALHTTVSEDPGKLKLFASVLLQSEQTIPVAKDILKEYDQTFPSEVNLQPTFQYDFDQMRMKFGKLFYTVAPLIAKGIPSLEDLKTYLRMCFRELRPLLTIAESFNNVMETVQDKCTIINICCLEEIVDQYDIREAKLHITNYNTSVDKFCEKIKADVCCNQSFMISSSSHQLTCETIVFILEWEADKYTLFDIRGLLSKAFKDIAKKVQVKAVNEGNSIIVTCYAPQSLIDLLLMTAKENLNSLKQLGVIKLSIGYHTIYHKCQRDKEIRPIVEENTKELKSQLELRQTISKKMILQISSVVQQSGERKERKEKTIKDLISLLKLKEVIKEELLSVSAERQKELETLQEVIMSLTLQLRERNKQFEALRQNIKDLVFRPKVRKTVTDQGLEKTQKLSSQELITETTGHTGSIQWRDDDNSVKLTNPSVIESEDVVSKLIKEQQTGKEWSIRLFSSSPESTAVIINNLNKCTVRRLDIWHTSLDSKCVSILSEILKTNKTIKTLWLYSSSLTGGIKQVSDSLFNNKMLEQLWLSLVTDITDEDMTHLSTMLSSNTTLKELQLYNCNITDNGVRYIYEGLTKNQTLTTLDIGYNHQITSVSTSIIEDLIQASTSLTRLYLHNTSLNNDDIKTICTSLTKNTTIRELHLSRQHEKYCKKLDSHQVIKDRLKFWL